MRMLHSIFASFKEPVRMHKGKSAVLNICGSSHSQASLNRAIHEPLFRYTSGRWLYDEDLQLKHRYVKFNVDSLLECASQVVGARCCQLTKLPEELYNKVFSLETEDGKEILARIPNPNAGSSCYIVASEVATLDFLCNVLDISVPEVVDWSSSSSLSHPNPVGAEYILMKRIKGLQLSEVWPTMSEAQRFRLVKNVVAIEAKLAGIDLLSYGSLYYRDIYPDGLPIAEITSSSHELTVYIIEKFVFSPSTDRMFWVDEKRELELDQGPWLTATEYISAIAKCEIICIQNLNPDESGFNPLNPGRALVCESHIELLEQFLTVLPHILLRMEICCPVLLHHDLHTDNIFVDDADPTKISGIIDWQGVTAGPLFMQARFPSVFDCEDSYPWGAVQPELHNNFDSLSEQEKAQIMEQHDRVRLKKFYELASRKFNPDITKAMDAMRNDDDPTSFVFFLLGQTSVDGPIPLRELLIQIYEKWDWISVKRGLTMSCLINFTEEEISTHWKASQEWAEVFNEFNCLLMEMGGKDGPVSHDEFEEATHRFNEHKEVLEGLQKHLSEII
ncbi:phosphotransferase enzyme family protein [Blastomyces dermatitidis ER-3]|uniref:Altered inheritance of mitochondria protein 9, mitochondrial n=1 Tax=Ajellomyces dermatitidis (strain ER-3 / ATCC MYA-2586) TaxID=559297 RepID=A0ABX2VXQ1_AJEDR|nr:phosphotransferase enzyme family protein [Blastomyces dermatitidis ER-3]OAT01925.1 phosphotransferase enzyme family protein [Blastomyces dermatitidis ER-3]